MNDRYTYYLNTFDQLYGFSPETVRHHQVVWTGYADPALIEEAHGVQMDFNYYNHGSWLNPGDGYKNGWMTGSGIPMKFSVRKWHNLSTHTKSIHNLQMKSKLANKVCLLLTQQLLELCFLTKVTTGIIQLFVANFHPQNWVSSYKDFGDAINELC